MASTMATVGCAQAVAEAVIAETAALVYDELRPLVPKTKRLLGVNLTFERQPFLCETRHSTKGQPYRVIARLEWDDKPGESIVLLVDVEGERRDSQESAVAEAIFRPDGRIERR